MTLIPAPYVVAPEPRAVRYGLLAAANGPLDLPTPHGRGGGIKYEPVSCGHANRWDVECVPVGSPGTKVLDPADETIEVEPFVVYGSYTCGSVGKTPAEIEAKAIRRLANGEQSEVEAALGEMLGAGATLIAVPDASDINSVVGALEQWLYGSSAGQQMYGNVGYIHAPARFETYFSDANLIEKVGSVWQTRMGTVVVFGGGYPDDGMIYISGQVTVWRSADVFVYPARQVMDREFNQWIGLAEREYAVAYDCLAASTVFQPVATAGIAPPPAVGGGGLVLFSSASRTATPTPAEVATGAGTLGLHLVIDVTAITATPNVTPRIEGYDSVSGQWYLLLQGAAITTTGVTVLKVYPGITAIANVAASDVVPDRIRVVMTHADADAITYTVAAHMV